MWIDKGDYTIPMVPDLDKYNLSIVEWLEEVVGEYPRGDYMHSENSYEEEDDHWTAIARSLDAKQLNELNERIDILRSISYKLREFQERQSLIITLRMNAITT